MTIAIDLRRQELCISSVLTGMLVMMAGCGKPLGSEKEVALNESVLQEWVSPVQGQYADINDLRMYYEIHGTGKHLVVIHGALGRAVVPSTLALDRRLIVVELQGHGHTADIDRPLRIEQMADDVAALLRELKVERTDVYGYSLGGTVALGMAIRHPDLVDRVAIYGSQFGSNERSYEPEAFEAFKNLPSDFAPPTLKDPYDEVAPHPDQWPILVGKIKRLGLEWNGFTHDQLKSIRAAVFVAVGDRDVVRPEHAVEMYRLIPNAQLMIVPNADHFLFFSNPEKLLTPVVEFLNADSMVE